ncbi:four helix bundle protein [Echinicola shivajiensis]|uniref:four helix bundle protein n=1 Tax=Echinicola shivajiensis TaxID=1035916 RepID=UPI001BFC55B5|nr:four helix bundle protein [Echinicola shivajiensis]
MKFKFENLIIWQKAMNLSEAIIKTSEHFPKSEMYNITSQIMRAADSIALNIAEGAILQSSLEQKRFLGYAIRSLAEVVTCLHKVKRRNYIDELKFNQYYQQSFDLMNMMIAYRKSIKQ